MIGNRCLHDLVPDADVLLELQPEELAGVILELFNSLDAYYLEPLLNAHNFSLPHIVEGYPDDKKGALSRALMEAWTWLLREGFLAPKPGSGRDGFVFITRKGVEIKSRSNLESYQNANILPINFLHPDIALKIWANFLRGDYDIAVLTAYREVEVAIRKACGYPDTDYGEAMIRKAFHKDNGPLTDQSLPEGERLAVQHLFAGAYGYY